METNRVTTDLLDIIDWSSFFSTMESNGFIKTTKLSIFINKKAEKYKNPGNIMLVGNRIQSGSIRDTSHLYIISHVIFRPKTLGQLKTIVKSSMEHSIPITFASGKTGLSGGYANYAITVDLADLESLKDPYVIDVENKTIKVAQNVLISELISIVPKQTNEKFIFPVQPASAFKLPVRVGGSIASNASGVTSGKLGAVDEWLEEAEIMLPNGEIKSITKNNPLFNKIVGGNGYYGIILSGLFRLYEPTSIFKRAILYGENMITAFKGLQNVLDLRIHPLISEFVTSPESLPGKFKGLYDEENASVLAKWAVLIKGAPDLIDKFIDVMVKQSKCSFKMLDEDQFQFYMQERSALALFVQTSDKSGNYIGFPGFEDILAKPKELPQIIDDINHLLTQNGFREVIFGYGHINFRKGQGLLLHMRLPVPIEHFYRENKELMKNVGETVYSVIRLLKSKYKIRFKAEHSPGPFHIWLDTDYRKNLRKDIEDGKAFFNPHLEIFDRVLVQKLKAEIIPYDNLKAFDEYLPEDLEKMIFESAIFNYLGN